MPTHNPRHMPEGWRETTLGEVVEIIGGGTPKTTIESYWDGDIPWLSVVDFNSDDRWVSKTEKSITQEGLDNSSTKLLNRGDIIISARGTVGALAQLKVPMTFNQSCYGIREIDGVSDENYLYYLIKFQVKQISKNVHGAVFDTITRDTFDSIKILLPPLPEQRAIADILSSLDAKIELLREQNQTLEKTAQTIFHEWFGRYSVESPEELPEGWRVGKVSDFVNILSGFAFKSDDFDEEGEYRLVTIANVQDGSFVENTKDGLSKIPHKMPEYCHLKTGDILLSLTGNVGRICHVVGEKYLLNQRVAKLKAKNENDFGYIYIYFRQNGMIELLESISAGTAQQNLSPIKTAELEAIIPDRKMLDKFAELCNPTITKILSNLLQIQSLSKTRDILLPKLMSGEVRIPFNQV